VARTRRIRLKKWWGGSDDDVTGTGTTAAGRKSFRQDAKPDLSGCIFDGEAVKSAFALLSTKVTKPVPIGTKRYR